MPLFYQHTINGTTKIGVWHIAEPESFFLEKVPLQSQITHWNKRLQHLAGRYLLQELFPGFPYHLIEIADTRKPFLPNEEYHFSISHCGDYAAVIVSKDKRVGIDIELVTPKIDKIKHKFLSDQEQKILSGLAEDKSISESRILTTAWSIKEAMFKWFGDGGIDFKDHLKIEKLFFEGIKGTAQCKLMKEKNIDLEVELLFLEGNCLAWIVTAST